MRRLAEHLVDLLPLAAAVVAIVVALSYWS
jgi:hypothetical protein